MTALLDLIDEIEDIKSDLRTAINNKGGSLTSSTPFSGYVTAVENLPSAEAVLSKTLTGAVTFNTTYAGASCLSNNQGITSISLPNCTTVEERAFQSNNNMVSLNLPLYQGGTIDDATGSVNLHNYGSGQYACEFCSSLTTANISAMQIMPNDFFSRCPSLTTLVAPNLIGMYGHSFYNQPDEYYPQLTTYSKLKELNINFMNFKFLGNMTEVLREYIQDSDNNITNTLSFPNLLCVAEQFINIDTSDDQDPLYDITTLNLPNLKRIEDWTNIRCNITTLNLPSLIRAGWNSFEACNNLTTINIGSSVIELAVGAFQNCSNVSVVNIDIDENTQDEQIINNVINTAPWGLDSGVTINWTGTSE